MREHVPNEDLERGAVPEPEAPWDEIVAFAHTFHAYKVLGSLPRATGVTDDCRARWERGDDLPADLLALRTALFTTTRAAEHGYVDASTQAFCRALVGAVRARL